MLNRDVTQVRRQSFIISGSYCAEGFAVNLCISCTNRNTTRVPLSTESSMQGADPSDEDTELELSTWY